jgi:hypothetical protein
MSSEQKQTFELKSSIRLLVILLTISNRNRKTFIHSSEKWPNIQNRQKKILNTTSEEKTTKHKVLKYNVVYQYANITGRSP